MKWFSKALKKADFALATTLLLLCSPLMPGVVHAASLPYEEHWEDFNVGQSPITLSSSWSGTSSAYTVVTNVSYTWLLDRPPLLNPPGVNEKVLALDTEHSRVTNVLQNTEGNTNVTMDVMVKFVSSEDEDAQNIITNTPSVKMGYYVNTNGFLVIYHGYYNGSYGNSFLVLNDPAFTPSGTYPLTDVEPWARITVKFDFLTDTEYEDSYFQISVNGLVYSNAVAYVSPGGADGGSWFILPNSPRVDRQAESVVMSGTGYLDDYLVYGDVFEAGAAVTVTFNAEGGTTPDPATKEVNVGANYGTLATTTRDGYAFAGWYTEQNGLGTHVTAQTTVTIDVNHNLYAHWTEDEPTTYTLTYTAGTGGSVTGTLSQVVAENGDGTLVGAVADAGYSFDQWDDGVLTAVRQELNVTSNITVEASFTGNVYTVTFEAPDATTGPTPGSKPVTFGDAYGALAETSRDDYTFDGWFTASEGGDKVEATSTVATATDHTLYAQWTPAGSYTLTYTAGAGGSVTGTLNQVVAENGDGTPVGAVADAGAMFDQWSDGVETASRTDTNVSNDVAATAWFKTDSGSGGEGTPISWFSQFDLEPAEGEDWTILEGQMSSNGVLTLRQAYLAGTNPTNENSVFRIKNLYMDGEGNWVVVWACDYVAAELPGYLPQYSTNLLDQPQVWIDLPRKDRALGELVATNAPPPAASSVFYRILATETE